MLTMETTIPVIPCYPICKNIEEALWFDIETTGLSPASSYLYLIGCAHVKEDKLHLVQWFSESISEEVLLLEIFLQHLQNFQILVHYNGTGFDLPYLSKKCAAYTLSFDFLDIISVDLYKMLLPYKRFLPLPGLKQKQVEEFIGIQREDRFTGEELISVYTNYLALSRYEKLKKTKKNSSAEYQATQASGLPTIPKGSPDVMLYALLLHNKEDIIGLYHSSTILAYIELFCGNARCTSFLPPKAVKKYSILQFSYELAVPLSKPFQYEYSLLQTKLHLSVKEQHVQLTIPIIQGEMKFFFDNYKEYYYLPAEDIAIHKSVAQFVEKEFKEKAKAANCYSKKESSFLPQWSSLFSPAFRQEYKEKSSYFEYNLLLEDEHTFRQEMLLLYAEHILHNIFT